MKQLVFLTVLILAFSFGIFAQTNGNLCPQIKFTLPNKSIVSEEPTAFAVEVGKNDSEHKFRYEWTFSRGKILKGQGTAQIEFIANEEDAGANFTVSVKVSGLPKGCSDTYSDIFAVTPLLIREPFDDMRKIALDDYKARLDSFMISLSNTPHSEGLIALEFSKTDKQRYKISLLRNINKHFIFRKFDLTRITFAINEAEFEERTLLWHISAGGKFPEHVKNYQIVKAEELERKLKELFAKQ